MTKKKYQKPEITRIELDNTISLVMSWKPGDGKPPGPPGKPPHPPHPNPHGFDSPFQSPFS